VKLFLGVGALSTITKRSDNIRTMLPELSLPGNEIAALFVAISFAAGLNDRLYVTAGIALVGAVCALLLIRSKDFVSRAEPQAAPAGDAGAGTGSVSQVRSA